MPASMYLTAAQLDTLSQCEEDLIILEQPGTVGAGDIEAWICEPDQVSEHRSLIIETTGAIISDLVLGDDA
jgi:hypothetical protein